jgi:hypothetical protein
LKFRHKNYLHMKRVLLLFASGFISFSVLAQGTWVQKANYGGPATEKASGFSIGTKGYIGIGTSGTLDFWEWDQGTNTWTQKANFTGPSSSFGIGFSIGTKGYFGTGGMGQAFYEWDQTNNTWTQKNNVPFSARTGAAAWSISGKGYIATGSSGGQELWEYDPAGDTWTAMANFPGAAIYWSAYFSIGTKGYLGTGYDGSGNNRMDFWEWDQTNNTWTQKANFITARRASVGFSIATNGYMGLGYDSNYCLDWWEYDPLFNTWTQVANFGGAPSCCHVTFTIGNSGYIGTGYEQTNGESQLLWEYTPGPTAVSASASSSVFTLYHDEPNSMLNVNSTQDGTLGLFDASGKKIQDLSIRKGSSRLLLAEQASGIYFYVFTSGDEAARSGKLLVK